MTLTVVDRVAGFFESRISRRNLFVRSVFVGSALSVGGMDFVLKPGSAYGAICTCGNSACGCGSLCCDGFSEFCCVLNGGYNYCPENTVMGGWWKADGSRYCNGPRYYMDCNATCHCTAGCGGGYQFCEPGCDGTNCNCAGGDCNNWLTGCFQFRYGQCNQDVACMGRIVCRVVACIPPWEIDATCTTTNAEDDATANMNVACNTAIPAPPESAVAMAATANAGGYWIEGSDGGIFTYGDAPFYGSVPGFGVGVHDVVGMAPTPDGKGYWMVASDGGIFTFGDAPFFGSMGGTPLNKPVVGMAPTPDGKGYWMVASDGGIFTFGDAPFFGSMGGTPLNKPVVGMAPTPDGKGYWMVASDGGIFTFGDAPFFGSMGGTPLNKPVVGMAPTPDGKGYWMVASDGGIFTFGDAPFFGSMGGTPLNKPVVGMAPTPDGKGYWMVASDGGIFTFGDAPFFGSEA